MRVHESSADSTAVSPTKEHTEERKRVTRLCVSGPVLFLVIWLLFDTDFRCKDAKQQTALLKGLCTSRGQPNWSCDQIAALEYWLIPLWNDWKLEQVVCFRSYSSTRLFTLSTSFNEKNEQDDKQAQRSVHLESQSSLTIVSIVDSSLSQLSILQLI